MNIDPKDHEEDDNEMSGFQHDEDDDGMKERFPDSTKESRNAGRFLGVDFPYVPGDPDF